MKGLVLAAGEGSRLRPFTFSRPKHLIPLLGKAMVQYPVEDLVSAGVVDVGVVIGYFGDMIKAALGDGSKFGARLSYILQERRLGIAHAIHKAVEDGFVDEELVVYLGDNILCEGVGKYVEDFLESGSDAYVLLAKVRDPSAFGVAVLKDGRVARLVEKPREPPSDLALVGVYMFRDPDLVERAFRTLRPSWRGEYEVTELIQWFIDNGYSVRHSVISGWWKDVGTYEGLLDAIYLLLDNVDSRIEGAVEGEVKGRVVIEEGAVVEGAVIGPSYVGAGVTVGKGAVVEHYVSIEHGSAVHSGRVARSLIMDGAEVNINDARLVDSVVGSRSRVFCRRGVHGDLKLALSDYGLVSI